MNVVILIPAYNPNRGFVDLVRSLAESDIRQIVVVNDGSRKGRQPIFERIKSIDRVTLLEHVENRGKGAALKTGLEHIRVEHHDSIGVVTADCDGQHCVEDIIAMAQKVAEDKGGPILGARTFGREYPLLKRLGNRITRSIMRVFYGLDLKDAQTGLRGIPTRLIPGVLQIPYNRYEFETEMLLVWKSEGLNITDIPIRTIDLPGHVPAHFSPLIDSMRIYFVLSRYVLVSIITAATDYMVFLLAYPVLTSVLATTYFSRLIALCINYFLVRQFVFCSRETIMRTFFKYVLLVVMSGFISAALVEYFVNSLDINIVAAKMISDLMLYVAIFVIQRDLVFVEKDQERVTDWDAYYESPYKTAHFSRAVTTRRLIANIERHMANTVEHMDIAELGGANSCFYASLREKFHPRKYCMCDNNTVGLDKIRETAGGNKDLQVQECDVLDMSVDAEFDVVFSVGLIEHFSVEDTAKAIKAHFDILRPGGIAIISFPSPTFLYRATRMVAEMLRLWIFHDERPLEDEEVDTTLSECGTVLNRELIWQIFLTQRMVVVRKSGTGE